MDITNLVYKVEPIMKEVGSFIISRFNGSLIIREKKERSLVTDVDILAEQLLIEQLQSLLPDASFIAEESGNSGNGCEYVWVIDPIDGTTNFIHGLPYFCISVALTQHDIPIWGAVYAPLTREFMYAYTNGGTFLNGKRMSVSSPILGENMIVIGFPYAKEQPFVDLLDRFKHIAPKTFALRHFGAAALDAAYVACGKLDGIFLANLAWWDIAAGMILIKEAGGIVTDFNGNPITKQYDSFIAAGKPLYDQLRQLIQ
jgi:myo-inositol-1(or 4)-monophosphatase